MDGIIKMMTCTNYVFWFTNDTKDLYNLQIPRFPYFNEIDERIIFGINLILIIKFVVITLFGQTNNRTIY